MSQQSAVNQDFKNALTSLERNKHEDKQTRGSSTMDLR